MPLGILQGGKPLRKKQVNNHYIAIAENDGRFSLSCGSFPPMAQVFKLYRYEKGNNCKEIGEGESK